jgi:hypothetical protein
VGFLKTTLLYFHKYSLHMVFPFRNPKHLYTKEDYHTADMLQRRLQYRYIIRWLATNGEVEEGMLSEGSHSSVVYGSMVLCSTVSSICYPASSFIATEGDFNYLDNTIPHGQLCFLLHYRLQQLAHTVHI